MTLDAATTAPADLRFRLGALWVLTILMALTAVREGFVTAGAQPFGIDFLPMWTAARDWLAGRTDVYDFIAITGRQEWLIEARHGMRPFVYPPSGLLLFLPFGALPFWIAYGLWTAATAALFVGLTVRFAPSHKVMASLIALVASPCATVVFVGQATFLIGAMAILAVVWLKSRPIAAGVLLGLAAAIKPQAMLLAPLVLIAGGHWRTLIAAGAAGAVAGLVSILAFGPRLWLDWIEALPAFTALVRDNEGLMRGSITPTGLAAQLDLEGPALWLWRGGFALAGMALAVLTFRRTEEPAPRLAAMLGGALLIAPYATFYDAGLLVPAAVWMVLGSLEKPGWLAAFSGLLLLVIATMPWLGGLAILGFMIVTLAPVLATGRRFSLS